MQNAYLSTLFLLLSYCFVHAQEKIADFPLEDDRRVTRRGQFEDQLFFSVQSNFSNAVLWRYDISEQEIARVFPEDYVFIDMITTNSGLYFLLRESNPTGSSIKLWYWSGAAEDEPAERSSHFGNNGQFLAQSADRVFFEAGQSIYTFEFSIPVTQALGFSTLGIEEGVLWQGSYYWINNNQATRSVLRARPGTGLTAVASGDELLYDLRAVNGWLIWRSNSGLFRFKPNSPVEKFVDFATAGIHSAQLSGGVTFNDTTYFFSVDTDETGQELWQTNGTPEGTFLFKDLATGPNIYGNEADGDPRMLHRHEGKLYFLARNPDIELIRWESDGTPEGTIPLENISESRRWKWTFSQQWVQSAGYVLSVHFSDKGFEPAVFRGDLRTYDIYEGPGNGLLFDFRILNDYVTDDGTLITEAINGEHGREPWVLRTDGTQALLGDLAPASAWSTNYFIGDEDGYVFSISGNEDQGFALYRLSLEAPPTVPEVPLPVDWLQTMSPPVLPSNSINWSYSTGLAAGTDGSWYTAGAMTYGGCNLMFSRGETPIELSNTCTDLYVARLTADGRPEWQLNLPGSFLYADMPVIQTAPEGGVYAAGRFFQDGFIGDLTFNSALGDGYLTRIDADGNPLWLRQFSTSIGRIFEIESDEEGNVWVIGLYGGQARFEDIVLNSPVDPSYFVAHWNAEGALQWAKSIEPSLDWPSWGPVYATELDGNGNLWLMINNAGHNSSTNCDFGSVYGLLVKLDPQGETLVEEEWEGDDLWYSTDLAINSAGNLLLTGRFRGTLQTGAYRVDTGEENDCASTGFIAKINGQTGKTFRIRAMSDEQVPEAILSRDDGTYTIAGYQNLEDQINYPGFSHAPFDRKDGKIFAQVYSERDSLLAERAFLAREDFNSGGFIYLLPGAEDRLVMQGECNGPLDTLAAGQFTNLFSQYVYLTSFALPYEVPEDLQDDELAADAITIAPNPTTDRIFVEVEDADFSESAVLLFNTLGQQVNTSLERFDVGLFTMDLSALPAGLYYLVVPQGDRLLSKEIVKQ